MSLILHTGDVHLDSQLTGLLSYEGAPEAEVQLATRRAFTNTVDLALDEGVDVFLIAGDLYDREPRDGKLGLFLASELSRLRRAGVEVVLVHGNHDAESVIPRRLPLPEGVHVLPTRRPTTVPFPKLGVAVHGQSYGRRDVTEDLAAKYPDPVAGMLNIGLLHTAATGRAGYATYAPCSVESLVARGYSYWALGHVHEFEVLAEDPWVVFCGCPQGRGLREIGEKNVVLIEAEGEEVLAVERRAVDVVRFVDVPIDLSAADSHEEAQGRIHAALTEVVGSAGDRVVAARVRLTGRTSLHRTLGARPQALADDIRAIGNDAGAGQLWIAEVACETEPLAATDLASRRDPIARMLQDSRALAAEPARLLDQAPSISDLTRLLPAGVLDAEHGGPEDEAWLAARAAGAERLLLGRLGNGLEAA